MIYNKVQSGTSATAIREKITTQLKSTYEEYIDFRKYDYLGATIGTERKQVLYSNKNRIKGNRKHINKRFFTTGI